MGSPFTYPDRLSARTGVDKGERVPRAIRGAAALTVLAASVAGCSGGSSTSTAVRPASAAVTTGGTASSAAAPTGSGAAAASAPAATGAVAATPSGSPTTTTAAPTTTAVATTSAAPTTAATKPGKPLSPYEADPGVTAMRAWAAQFANTVNAGHVTDPALNALMTPQLAAEMQKITGGEQGHRYPGPLPFTPERVVVTSATARYLPLCVVVDGFSINPKTHKPYGPRTIRSMAGRALVYQGRWVVSAFDTATFSCKGVKVPEPTW